MKNNTPIKIGVSGKRNIRPEDRDKVYKEIRTRIMALLKQHNTKEFIGYTALAAGVDTVFAEVVEKEFGKPLHVILPFPVEEYEKDFTGEDLATFRSWIGKTGASGQGTSRSGIEHTGADDQKTSGGGTGQTASYGEGTPPGGIKQTGTYDVAASVPTSNESRNMAYYLAGKMVVDQCDEMIIVWDGLRPGGTGGTAEILGYLSEKKKPHPSYISVKPVKADPLHDELIHTYYKANRLAIKARNRYKRVWKWAIFLGWLTVVCFAIKTAFHVEDFWGRMLTFLEFLFVMVVYILIFFARRKNYHGDYLEERMKAETSRLLRNFYHAGIQVEVSDQSKGEDTMLAGLGAKINGRLADIGHRSKWYTQYVIKSLIDNQCSYHNNKIRSIGDNHDIFERINLFIGVLFIVNLAMHLTHVLIVREGVSEMWLYKGSVFFNILLPASYAAMEGVIYFNEWSLLRKYSETARASLKEAESYLPKDLENTTAEECYNKQAQTLHQISRVMLTDNRNWNLLLENKDNYHLIV